MHIKRIPISDLKAAKHNPLSRTQKREPLARLARSIEEVGLIYPIIAAKDNTVIDGHRRLEAMKKLGWETIPVLYVSADNKDQVYAEVNVNSSKLSGNQNLQVWLKNPDAVTRRERSMLDAAQELLGISMLKEMARGGQSLLSLRRGREIAAYLGHDGDREWIVRCTKWVIEHHCGGLAAAYIKLLHHPKALLNAVTNNTPLLAKRTAVLEVS